MKKTIQKWLSLLLVIAMALGLCPVSLAEETTAPAGETTQIEEAAMQQKEAPAETADWTVMVYLCGTDLESQGAMASINLMEIADTLPTDDVNVIIETGGTHQWQSEGYVGIEIANDKLQRWSFGKEGYQLVEEQPLANMADDRTLAEFVRWSAASYPAEKYLLVMWDHGGGSNTGLIVDELHNMSVMSLEGMSKGLAASGVHLEALMLDTCLMASLETAQAVQPYANYLIAAEETVPGYGSAYDTWLQYLYDYPYVDGRQFGKVFCDYAQQKYAEIDNDYYNKTLTFSVIDLKKLDAVTAAFEAMFVEINGLLTDPEAFGRFTYLIQNTESFAAPEMLDLQDFAMRASRYGLSIETVGAVIEAVSEAVVHNVKGLLHSYSHGISFWYKPNARQDELDHFARNCKNPSYLAFLDAVNMGWTAPNWVYEQMERLPDITRKDYIPTYDVMLTSDNHLQLNITNAKDAVARVDYRLLMAKDDMSAEWISLGLDDEMEADWEEGTFWDTFDGTWPMLGDAVCQIEMVNATSHYTLYNVPIGVPHDEKHPELGFDTGMLRVGYEYEKPLTTVFEAMSEPAAAEPSDAEAAENANADTMEEASEEDPFAGHYAIYGLWSEPIASANIQLASRDVVSLDSLYDRSFYTMGTNYSPLDGVEGSLEPLSSFTLTQDMIVEEKPLPSGKYAYQFVITDVFGNQINTMFVPFTWDGKNIEYDHETYETLRELLSMIGLYI